MKTNLKTEEKIFIEAIKDIDEEAIDEFIEDNSDEFFKSLPNGDYKKNIMRRIFDNYKKLILNPKASIPIIFYKSEVDFLKSLPNEEIKRLFYSLFCKAKVRPHSSGWFRLDFPECLQYGFGSKAKKMKITDFAKCHEYGFDARVIGSANPVLCFCLPVAPEGDVVIEVSDDTAYEMFSEVIK